LESVALSELCFTKTQTVLVKLLGSQLLTRVNVEKIFFIAQIGTSTLFLSRRIFIGKILLESLLNIFLLHFAMKLHYGLLTPDHDKLANFIGLSTTPKLHRSASQGQQ
jgi:hypothetical protein